MPRPTRFAKLSGAGNDFVLVPGPGSAALARRLCDRRGGVGADGLLAVRGRRVEYRNADGTLAFCGNGARCAAWWLNGGRRGSVRFSLSGVPCSADTFPGGARLRMPDASAPRTLAVRALGRDLRLAAVDTGVPHAVVRTAASRLPGYPVLVMGRLLRRHRAFGRPGTNVNFVSRSGSGLRIRTYERGVEDETLACGTGAVAAALCSGLPSPVAVRARGGLLSVSFTRRKDGGFTDVWLTGPVRLVFTGEVSL
ncbi:MAG: diaminopimelate epimerase [Elusimicrobia bacterium]|nr:diaminopimelate epimerase [Elusimicrobiota bacterium]